MAERVTEGVCTIPGIIALRSSVSCVGGIGANKAQHEVDMFVLCASCMGEPLFSLLSCCMIRLGKTCFVSACTMSGECLSTASLRQ